MIRLYHFPICPFCRKVRLALREKGLASELVQEEPWEQRDGFVALNHASEAPVLEDDGRVVVDSTAICEYLDEVYPEIPLLGPTSEDRAETRRLVAWFDVKFNREVTDRLWREKLLKRLKRDGTPNSAVLRDGAAAIRFHLDYIGALFEMRKWLAGEEISLADLTAAAHLSVLDYLGDVPWATNAAAKEWYAKVKSRPSFRPLLQDRIISLSPPAHYEDLDF